MVTSILVAEMMETFFTGYLVGTGECLLPHRNN